MTTTDRSCIKCIFYGALRKEGKTELGCAIIEHQGNEKGINCKDYEDNLRRYK